MSAKVTYFLSDDISLHHYHNHSHLYDNNNNHQTTSNMPTANIAVRPPCRVQTRTLLVPPVVAQLNSNKCGSGTHFFTTAVLLDPSTRAVAEGLLDGTTAVTGVLLDATTMIFAFPDLSIVAAGNYTMRLDVYGMYPDSTEGATLIAQLETAEISVHDGPVANQRPCKLSSLTSSQGQRQNANNVTMNQPHQRRICCSSSETLGSHCRHHKEAEKRLWFARAMGLMCLCAHR